MAATTLMPAVNTMNLNTSTYYDVGMPQAVPSPPNSKSSAGTMSQTPPSSNISPTNHHSNGNARQLRALRQPLYIPAALRPTDSKKSARPTDIPGRPRAPDTPPASQDSSFDSARTESPAAIEFVGGDIAVDQVDDSVESMRRGLSRAASENYSVEELGQVTGPPTTAHWKPDESSTACWICNESFTWFFRRHHCRRCGNLVCDYHIRFNVPLDQNARYHPQGTTSKACKSCYDGWKVIKKLHHSRTSSIAESSHSSQGTAMPIPKAQRPGDDVHVGSMARSEGMVWSTF